MKNVFIALILILMAFGQVEILLASQDVIYIAEPVITDDLDTAKTLISIFKPDGTEIKKIYVNGVMARVSPDGKYIVYSELKETEPQEQEIVIADSEGKRIRNLPIYGKHKRPIKIHRTANLIWSPDGEKIAIVSDTSIGISTGVFYLKTDNLKPIYNTGRSQGELASYSYSFKWFPDSKRILFTPFGETTNIVDIESNTTIHEISKDSMTVAYLTENGKKIIYIPQLDKSQLEGQLAGKSPFNIWQYDVKEQRGEIVMTLDIPPLMAALSHDGRYLIFQNLPLKETSIFVADLLNKKLTIVDTKGLMLIPKKFSPQKNNLVICMAGKKAEQEREKDIMLYGIFNLDTGEFKKLKETSFANVKGELGWLWLMGYDWYDWR